MKQENNGMSADWGRYLEQNATKGKITIATAKNLRMAKWTLRQQANFLIY